MLEGKIYTTGKLGKTYTFELIDFGNWLANFQKTK